MKFYRKLYKPTLPAFALMEVVAALAIITLSSTYFVSTIARVKEAYSRQITKTNIELVIKLLADFVAQKGRLPYPGSIDGFELMYEEWPEDDTGWIIPENKLMRGIIPYRTIGVSPDKVKDGYGYFLTYRVNPTLCGRKNIKSVPPGTIRERFENYESKLDQNLYSCFTAVRSYQKTYSGEESEEEQKNQTKAWDIAFRLKHAQIKCYTDGKENELYGEYSLIPTYQQISPDRRICPMEMTRHLEILDDGDPEMIARNQTINYPKDKNKDRYLIKDCIAIVIISHGPSHGGAISATGEIIPLPKNASKEKIQNSNNSADPSICYTNSTNVGLFDDIVVWISRFELATKGDFKMRPFNILRTKSMVNPTGKIATICIKPKDGQGGV